MVHSAVVYRYGPIGMVGLPSLRCIGALVAEGKGFGAGRLFAFLEFVDLAFI